MENVFLSVREVNPIPSQIGLSCIWFGLTFGLEYHQVANVGLSRTLSENKCLSLSSEGLFTGFSLALFLLYVPMCGSLAWFN